MAQVTITLDLPTAEQLAAEWALRATAVEWTLEPMPGWNTTVRISYRPHTCSPSNEPWIAAWAGQGTTPLQAASFEQLLVDLANDWLPTIHAQQISDAVADLLADREVTS